MTFTKRLNCHKNNLFLWAVLVLFAGCGHSVFAQNLTELEALYFTADIDNKLPGTDSDVFSNDATIIAFDFSTWTAHIPSGSLVDYAEIDAYHRSGDGCGAPLYSIGNTTKIGGFALMGADVFDSFGNKTLDAAVTGIPSGVNVDAVSRDPGSCDLVISIDITTVLDGIAFKPDDLIRWNSTSGFSLYHAIGLNANIDALHLLTSNQMLISFDTAVVFDGLAVKDEDVVEIRTGSGAFQLLAFEPALLDGSWHGADLNSLWALPVVNDDLIFVDGFE